MNAFDDFYRGHIRLVYAMALARGAGPSLAEDLAQETFLRAWRHFGLLAGMDPPAQRAWLIRVVRNLAHDAWRREPMTVDTEGEPDRPALESGERAALRLDVARALACLEEPDRELVVLRYFLELNSREIGEILGMPEGTVRRRLVDCRRQLRERLLPWRP
ncbi:MAG TPA: RNA polymerase sigma factor [Chthonomonadaceae bacterium]|nr:RNA polymerase sigma factor [Chthonomonadaceae bacterium]